MEGKASGSGGGLGEVREGRLRGGKGVMVGKER